MRSVPNAPFGRRTASMDRLRRTRYRHSVKSVRLIKIVPSTQRRESRDQTVNRDGRSEAAFDDATRIECQPSVPVQTDACATEYQETKLTSAHARPRRVSSWPALTLFDRQPCDGDGNDTRQHTRAPQRRCTQRRADRRLRSSTGHARRPPTSALPPPGRTRAAAHASRCSAPRGSASAAGRTRRARRLDTTTRRC